MSLKAFHLIFVTVSTLLSLGVAWWGMALFRSPHGDASHLIYGIGGLISAVALVVYGRYFLKKLRHVSYL